MEGVGDGEADAVPVSVGSVALRLLAMRLVAQPAAIPTPNATKTVAMVTSTPVRVILLPANSRKGPRAMCLR
jgi:hypothetical protein